MPSNTKNINLYKDQSFALKKRTCGKEKHTADILNMKMHFISHIYLIVTWNILTIGNAKGQNQHESLSAMIERDLQASGMFDINNLYTKIFLLF